MHYIRMFGIYVQDVLDDRLRAFVWFINPVLNGGFFMLFWLGAFHGRKTAIAGWDMSSILTYYLLVLICATMIMSHYDETVELDIRNSNIIRYLLKPFPYYWFAVFDESPNRILQGIYAIITYLVIAYFYPPVRLPLQDIFSTFLIIITFVNSFFLTHTYKLILGFITFWTHDIRVFAETSEVLILFLAGFNMPLNILPGPLQTIATYLPFAYFVYFPVLGIEGKLSPLEILQTALAQFFWLIVFALGYRLMLQKGLRKFTAAGQ